MALPSFPIRAFSSGGTHAPNGNPAYRTQNGVMSSVYGTTTAKTVSYSIAEVASTDLMRESKLLDIAGKAVLERQRRGVFDRSVPTGYFQGIIYGSRIQDIVTTIQVSGQDNEQAYNGAGQGTNSPWGYYQSGNTITYDNYGNPINNPVNSPVDDPTAVTFPKAAAPSVGVSFSKGDQISAVNINTLIRTINAAGNVCTCNCNYCTCNCNYCTCNCNYGCTCNCNYSDERVKADVEYM